jgi:predicted chitinase
MTTSQTSTAVQLPMLRLNDGINFPQSKNDVEKLQQALGFTSTEIDGKLGKDTENAVVAFQKKNGLVADGLVGDNTWSALLKTPVKTAPASSPPSPTVKVGSNTLSIDAIVRSIPFPTIRSFARRSVPLILQECNNSGVANLAQIAYILATAEHESHLGEWMEEFASGWDYEWWSELGNDQAGDGPRFKGRGFVQLTGRSNYTNWKNRLGIDIVSHPEKVMEPEIAAKILVQGMREGAFTTVKLNDYIGNDFVNARRIINHTDRAAQIAAIADEYLKVL